MCLFLVIISSLKKRRNSQSCSRDVEMALVPQQMARQRMAREMPQAIREVSMQLQSWAVRTEKIWLTTQSAAQKSSVTALLLRAVPFICFTRCWKVEQKLLQLVVRTGQRNVQSRQGGWARMSQSCGTEAMGKLRAEATLPAQLLARVVGRGRQRPARRQLGRIVSLAALLRSQGVCQKQARALTFCTAWRMRKTSCVDRKIRRTRMVRQYFLFSRRSSVSLSQSNLIFRSQGCFTRANSMFVMSSRLTISLNSFSRCHSDTCASTCRTTIPRAATFRSSYSFSNLKKDSKVSLCCLALKWRSTNSNIQATENPLRNPTLRYSPFLAAPTSPDHSAKVSLNFLSCSRTISSQFLESQLQYTELEGGMVGTVVFPRARGGRSSL